MKRKNRAAVLERSAAWRKTTESLKVRPEERTQRYGREIFARLEGTGPLPFGPSWWDERLMELTMGDEAVKLQLFRFVDVLPQLRAPADVTRHLREYFGAASDRVPAWIRFALRLLPSHGPLGRLLAGVARFSARRLARKFIAGSNVDEALKAIAHLRAVPWRSRSICSARRRSPRRKPTSRATSTSN